MARRSTVARSYRRAWRSWPTGEQHAAKDLARDLRAQFPNVTRKLVNSVLSVEGKGDIFYDRAAYTYSLSAPRGREE